MKISIALCTYNGEKYLREQLQSYCDQTRLPDELVVCDDCSSDSSAEILAEFAADAPFMVRFFVNKVNLGYAKNFSKAIDLCEGDIICVSDQDDVWYSNKLSAIEERFQKNDQAGVVYADATLVDQNLKDIGLMMWERKAFDENVQKDFLAGRAFHRMISGCHILGSSMAFRSAYKPIYFPIPENTYYAYDTWITLAITSVAAAEIIDTPLIMYRQHFEQISGGVDMTDAPLIEDLRNSTSKKNSFEGVIRQLRVLRDRLEQVRPDAKESIKKLDSALGHVEMRSSLAGGTGQRIKNVLSEWLRGNYSSYSNGFRSVIKDLFFYR